MITVIWNMYCSNIVRSLCDLRNKSPSWSGIKNILYNLNLIQPINIAQLKTSQTFHLTD